MGRVSGWCVDWRLVCWNVHCGDKSGSTPAKPSLPLGGQLHFIFLPAPSNTFATRVFIDAR